MTTLELYRKHKAGEISREKFLYEVRRDNNIPWVLNTTSYDDAVKILKNKGIINESHDGDSEDLVAMAKSSNALRNKPETKAIANKAAEKAKSKEQASELAVKLAKAKGINDSEQIQHIIDLAVTAFKNKSLEETSANKSDMIITLDYDNDITKIEDKHYHSGLDNSEDYEIDTIESDFDPDYTMEIVKDLINKHKWNKIILNVVKDGEEFEDTFDMGNWRGISYWIKESTLTEAKKSKKKKQPKELHIDVANPYEFRHGIQHELAEMDEYTDEALEKAKAKVLKNLGKDPLFYSTLLNQKQSPFKFKAPETDKPGMQAKADGHLKKELKKDEKANVKDTLGKKEEGTKNPKGVKEMTMTPKKAKGIKKTMAMPGKEKTIKLKENSDIKLMDFFLGEDKAMFMDEPADAEKYQIKKDLKGNIVQATNDEGNTFSKNDEAIAIDNGEKIKIASFKEEQGKVKALFNKGMFFSSIDIDGLKPISKGFRPGVDLGKAFGKLEAMKEYIKSKLKTEDAAKDTQAKQAAIVAAGKELDALRSQMSGLTNDASLNPDEKNKKKAFLQSKINDATKRMSDLKSGKVTYP